MKALRRLPRKRDKQPKLRQAIRRRILARDGYICGYCGQQYPIHWLQVDHVQAVTCGGSDEESNLLTACKRCNTSKNALPLDIWLATRFKELRRPRGTNVNKKEAAEFLGISERSLERHTAQKRIGHTLKPGKTRPVLDYESAELERFKEELKAEVHRPAEVQADDPTSNQDTPTNAASDGGKALATFGGLSGPPARTLDFFGALLQMARAEAQAETQRDAQRPTVDVADKLLLTLAEAQALTGLSRATLRDAIEADELKARQMGRTWRVKRSDLESYIKKL
jgi:excisionase family DNA binding protein